MASTKRTVVANGQTVDWVNGSGSTQEAGYTVITHVASNSVGVLTGTTEDGDTGTLQMKGVTINVPKDAPTDVFVAGQPIEINSDIEAVDTATGPHRAAQASANGDTTLNVILNVGSASGFV